MKCNHCNGKGNLDEEEDLSYVEFPCGWCNGTGEKQARVITPDMNPMRRKLRTWMQKNNIKLVQN